MTLDLTKPIQTRDGRSAKWMHTLADTDADYPLCVIVTNPDGREMLQIYMLDGTFFRGSVDDFDLQNIPESKYKLVYGDGYICPQSAWLASKAQFEGFVLDGRIGCLVQTGDDIVFEKL